ncbi:hypothetical protein NP493_564g02039 [Ridgeia piscesae]|uniref:Uncharacterized protein n=1 Tax=Ridgeia piscesae TaxID=27915 RepID=A0AAD9KVE4_RIDPI|nr:hypothetical protein NP493_564g02039 [Ridgeia piscesae]
MRSKRVVSSTHSVVSLGDCRSSPIQWSSGIPQPTQSALSPSRSVTLSSSLSLRSTLPVNNSIYSQKSLPYGDDTDAPQSDGNEFGSSDLTNVTDNGLSMDTTPGLADSATWSHGNSSNYWTTRDTNVTASPKCPSAPSTARSPLRDRRASCDMSTWLQRPPTHANTRHASPHPKTRDTPRPTSQFADSSARAQTQCADSTTRAQAQCADELTSLKDSMDVTSERAAGYDRQRIRNPSCATSIHNENSQETYEKVRREYQHHISAPAKRDRVARQTRRKTLEESRIGSKLKSCATDRSCRSVNSDKPLRTRHDDVYWRLCNL